MEVGSIGDRQLETLRGSLLSRKVEERDKLAAIQALARLKGHVRAAAILQEAAAAPHNGPLLKYIVRAFGYVGIPATIPTIAPHIESREPPLVVATLKALAMLDRNEAVRRAVAVVKRGPTDVVAAVTKILATRCREESRGAFDELARSAQANHRLASIAYARSLPAPEAFAMLLTMLRAEPVPEVGAYLAKQLARVVSEGEVGQLEALVRELRDKALRLEEVIAWQQTKARAEAEQPFTSRIPTSAVTEMGAAVSEADREDGRLALPSDGSEAEWGGSPDEFPQADERFVSSPHMMRIRPSLASPDGGPAGDRSDPAASAAPPVPLPSQRGARQPIGDVLRETFSKLALPFSRRKRSSSSAQVARPDVAPSQPERPETPSAQPTRPEPPVQTDAPPPPAPPLPPADASDREIEPSPLLLHRSKGRSRVVDALRETFSKISLPWMRKARLAKERQLQPRDEENPAKKIDAAVRSRPAILVAALVVGSSLAALLLNRSPAEPPRPADGRAECALGQVGATVRFTGQVVQVNRDYNIVVARNDQNVTVSAYFPFQSVPHMPKDRGVVIEGVLKEIKSDNFFVVEGRSLLQTMTTTSK